MSKIFWILISVALLAVTPAFAATDLANNAAEPSASQTFARKDLKAEAPKPSASQIKNQQERLKKIDERKKQLDNTEWDITLGSSDKRIKPEKDKLIFQNKMISVESFAKLGFGPSNYTVTVSENLESATFETMQTAKEGLLFIRGDWTKDTMQGNVSEQFEGGKKTVDYYFTSLPVKKIAPPAEGKKDAGVKKAASALKAMVSEEGSKEEPVAMDDQETADQAQETPKPTAKKLVSVETKKK